MFFKFNISSFSWRAEMCGVLGLSARNDEVRKDLGKMAYIGLFNLQHRGQESAGISVSAMGDIKTLRAMGTVDWVFRSRVRRKAAIGFIRTHPALDYDELETAFDEWVRAQDDQSRRGETSHVYNPLTDLAGQAAAGHARYSTRGASGNKNIHPIPFLFKGKNAVIVHNGNLVRLERLRAIALSRDPNYVFVGDSDTELIAALIATSRCDEIVQAIIETAHILEGAFSLVILYDDIVYALRDRHGLRPLYAGESNSIFAVASETGALDTLQCQSIREVPPGYIAILQRESVDLWGWAINIQRRSCVFEGIYFSRPDSLFVADKRVHLVRKAMGRILAREHPILDADAVISVPDSGNSAAIGYAEASGIPYEQAIVRGRVGRTFIEPVKDLRHEFHRLKHNFIPESIVGKHLIVVEDSIVRGLTMPKILARLRELGARKLSALVASPPVVSSCHLGVDIPHKEDLVAYGRNVEEIRQLIGADYLGYLSPRGVYEAIGMARKNFCDGCFTGKYPVKN